MKRRVYGLLILPFILSACANLHEAIVGRELKLQTLNTASLGITSREEISKLFGEPLEIDQRQFDSQRREVYFYQQRYQDSGGGNLPANRTLACEFNLGKLTGYWFEDSGDLALGDFDEQSLGKLLKGKTTRQEVAQLVGIPTTRALLPTTLTQPVLILQFGGAPLPLAQLPAAAAEVWQYHGASFNIRHEKTAQKILSLFFDAQGVFLGSVLSHELALQID